MAANKVFDYVVGYKWRPEEDDLRYTGLNVYAYHSQVHRGTKKQAKQFLEYVKDMQAISYPNEEPHDYKIYVVSVQELT